jgi:hypothetical protein
MNLRSSAAIVAFAALVAARAGILAQNPTGARPDSAVTLGTVKITAATADETHVTVLERLTLPATIGITARKIEETVNVMDTEDAVKYRASSSGNATTATLKRPWPRASGA